MRRRRDVSIPGKALRARADHGPARDDGDLAQRRRVEPHGDVRGRHVRLGLPGAGRQLLVHVREAGPLRVRVPHPQVHEGHGRRLLARPHGAGAPGPRRPAGRRRGARTGRDGSGDALPGRRRRASANRQGAARRQLHGALPGDGAGHLPRRRPAQAASPLVRIGVVPRVSVTHTATTVAVATVPARVGARVALQTYDRDHFTWRTVAHTRLDARSRARLPIPAARPLRIRVVVRGEAGWSDAASPVIALAGRS